MIILIPEVFLILEDGIKSIHAISSQKSDISNHSSNASCRESASGEADENNFVTRFIVRCNEGVNFSNVFTDAGAEHPAGDGINYGRTGANAGVIVNDLTFAVRARLPQSSGDTSDIARNLESASGHIWDQRRLLKTIVTKYVSLEEN